MMPEMDGVEAAMRIRNLGRRCEKMPIVALTANAVSGMKEMFLRYGFNDYLSKPIDLSKLTAVLEKWIPKEKQFPLNSEDAAVAVNADESALVEISIEGLDVKKGLAAVRGKADSYLQVLSVFCSDGREKFAGIKKALEANDIRLYTTYVHALKSASANIGADELSEAARNLETAGKDGNRAYIDSYTPMLMSYFEWLLDIIESQLKAINDKTCSFIMPDTGALKAALVKLKEAVTTVNIGAIRSSAKEIHQLAGSANAEVEGILQNTLKGEYDKAAAQIDGMLKSLG